MSKPKRFEDDFSSRYDFAEEFFVVCPKCSAQAKVIPSVEWRSSDQHKAERKVICSSCHFWDTKKPENGIMLSTDRDWFFGLPLYYAIETSQGTFYAYNDRHLDYLEDFVSAKVRTRSKSKDSGWSNQSQISRLPKWVKLAKNRELIIAAIKKVRAKC